MGTNENGGHQAKSTGARMADIWPKVRVRVRMAGIWQRVPVKESLNSILINNKATFVYDQAFLFQVFVKVLLIGQGHLISRGKAHSGHVIRAGKEE